MACAKPKTFVAPPCDLTLGILKALGFEGKPVRSLTLDLRMYEAVKVDVEMLVEGDQLGDLSEVLKSYNLVAVERPAVEVKPKRRTGVVAGNRDQFIAYCMARGLNRRDGSTHYVASTLDLVGSTAVDYVLTGTYLDRPQIHEMVETIKMSVACGLCTLKEDPV